VNTTVDLPENSQVSTVDLRKAASLAEPLSAGPVNRAPVKGLKEGDRVAFALDVTVDSVSQQIVTLATPFQGGGMGFPKGSVVARFDLSDQGGLAIGIPRGQLGFKIAIDDPVFVSRLQTGDILTVFYPFTMTVRSVTVADNGTQTLTIDAYTLDGALAAGAIVATLDNRSRLPLAEALPAGQPVTSLVVQGFAAKDSVVLSRRDTTFTSAAVPVGSVSPIGSVVYLDDNFLPYPGQHRITMEGA
jgi:hypothetical protein